MSAEDLLEGIDRWKKTGYGIDPQQLAFRHYGADGCQCHGCAGTPIVSTVPPFPFKWVGKR